MVYLVARRSARLAAATYHGVLLRIDPALSGPHVVAIDGSLYEKMPGYAGWIQECSDNPGRQRTRQHCAGKGRLWHRCGDCGGDRCRLQLRIVLARAVSRISGACGAVNVISLKPSCDGLAPSCRIPSESDRGDADGPALLDGPPSRLFCLAPEGVFVPPPASRVATPYYDPP